jgi:lactoylglutathione lyase
MRGGVSVVSVIEFARTIAVYVEDQNRALRFFTDQLGFELKEDRPLGSDSRWIEVAPPGAQSHLVIYPRALMKDWAERKASIVFKCANTKAAAAELEAKNVRIVMPPTDMPWGTFASFEDPDGNQFLLADTPSPQGAGG